jgi:hypothetical protein
LLESAADVDVSEEPTMTPSIIEILKTAAVVQLPLIAARAQEEGYTLADVVAASDSSHLMMEAWGRATHETGVTEGLSREEGHEALRVFMRAVREAFAASEPAKPQASRSRPGDGGPPLPSPAPVHQQRRGGDHATDRASDEGDGPGAHHPARRAREQRLAGPAAQPAPGCHLQAGPPRRAARGHHRVPELPRSGVVKRVFHRQPVLFRPQGDHPPIHVQPFSIVEAAREQGIDPELILKENRAKGGYDHALSTAHPIHPDVELHEGELFALDDTTYSAHRGNQGTVRLVIHWPSELAKYRRRGEPPDASPFRVLRRAQRGMLETEVIGTDSLPQRGRLLVGALAELDTIDVLSFQRVGEDHWTTIDSIIPTDLHLTIRRQREEAQRRAPVDPAAFEHALPGLPQRCVPRERRGDRCAP